MPSFHTTPISSALSFVPNHLAVSDAIIQTQQNPETLNVKALLIQFYL